MLCPCCAVVNLKRVCHTRLILGGGPRVVVSTAAFHARVRGSVPGLGGLKETKMFLPHPRVKVSIVGSLRDREVACSDRQGSNFESCVWRTVSSHSSHHPQEVLQAQFSLYVHKGGLKPDSFHFYQAYSSWLIGKQFHVGNLGINVIIGHLITSSDCDTDYLTINIHSRNQITIYFIRSSGGGPRRSIFYQTYPKRSVVGGWFSINGLGKRSR